MNDTDSRVSDAASVTEPCAATHANEMCRAVSDDDLAGAAASRPGDRSNVLVSCFLCLALAAVFFLSLGMIHTTRFGESYDDAIYVTAAKSLATGAGYRLISLPEPLAQTLIPPLYPLVLSLIWRVSPPFPGSLIWMMLLSALAMVGFLALAWHYLVSHNYATHWLAVAIVTLAGVNWRMMTLATSIISEILFALLIVATLHLAERYEREEAKWLGVVLGIVAGLTFLTRTSGLVVLIAVAVYLVLRRKWRSALWPVAVASLFVVAWLGWCYLNRNTGGGEHASYYAGYMRGIDTTVGQLQALNHSTRITTHLKIIETNAVGLILVWMPLQSIGLRSSIPPAVLVPLLLSFLALLTAGLVREVRKGIRLLHIFLLFYVVVHLIVPSHSYERYLMPIVPFLLLFVVREFSGFFSIMRTAFTSSGAYSKKAVPAFIALVLVFTAIIPLFSNSTGIYLSLTNTKATVNSAEDASAFEWITANTNPSDVLVCFADQKYYLFTGRKAVRSIPVNILDLVVYQDQGPGDDEIVKTFLNIVDENRGTYLVFGARDFEHQAPAYGKAVQSHLEQHPEQFVPEFRSASGDTVIYLIQRGQVAVRRKSRD